MMRANVGYHLATKLINTHYKGWLKQRMWVQNGKRKPNFIKTFLNVIPISQTVKKSKKDSTVEIDYRWFGCTFCS